MNLEETKKIMQIAKADANIAEYHFKIAEREQEIERLKGLIEKQVELKEKLEGER